ncbi:MAG: transposase [Pirellulales bacterium]|nr:transposase [Pirellulales bacterium]
MRRYLRSHTGRTFFFTLVTFQRRRFLTTPVARAALRAAFRNVRAQRPFSVVAIVLLPDHLHTVWELPSGDTDYSTRWRLIKTRFTQLWRQQGGSEETVSASRERKRERAIWQRRFYEHTCRDEQNLKRCVDYIHANPLKHGLVDSVAQWPWSSFHRYVTLGEYDESWGSAAAWHGDEFKHAE